MASQGSDTAAGGQAPKARRKEGRIVQSRYLELDKRNTKRVLGVLSSGVAQRKDSSSSSSSSNCSLSSSRIKGKSVLSQKHETSAGPSTRTPRTLRAPPGEATPEMDAWSQGGDRSSLNLSCFEKGDLQSTLLDEGKLKLPELDTSAINGTADPKQSSPSESASEEDSETQQTSTAADEETLSSDWMTELESETLLLTYLRIKAEKNVAKMEEKAEKNLLMLCEEKRRQQEKLREVKREILLQEREQKLNEALDKQIEALSPLVAACEQFKEQYKSFAASLDATRHELPMHNIHIEGDKQTYLDELGKQLATAQELLTEIMPDHSEDGAKALGALKELEEVSRQLSEGLQRSFTNVQDLSFDVSKEVCLHNQLVCEEKHGVDVVKRWYFN